VKPRTVKVDQKNYTQVIQDTSNSL